MNKQYRPLAHRRLQRLALEYQRMGYQVKLHPTAADLPPALANCRFELVALRGQQTIVATVRTKETLTLTGAANLHRISELVEKLDGWEFELVVTNPRKKVDGVE